MATVPETLSTAVQFHQAGRLSEAEGLYRQILVQEPENTEALHLLGVIAHQVGQNEISVELIAQAIARDAGNIRYHNNLGSALRALKRLDEAADSFRRALLLRPDFAEARNNLGLVLEEQGALAAALDCFRAALAIQPKFAPAYYNAGNVAAALGHREEAMASYRQALILNPLFVDAHNNLGALLFQSGAWDEAAECYRRALELRPNFASAHNNLGNVLERQGALDAAATCYERAVTLDRSYAAALSNLGNLRREQNAPQEAAALYEQAIALEPENAEAHANLGLIRLLLGDFARGWAEHDWRWRIKGAMLPARFAQPRWRGAPLDGATILLFAEQGLGDILQFVRYVPLVAARGGRVILHVPRELQRLLAGLPGAAMVVAEGDFLPPFSWQSSLLDLPLVFGTDLSTIPAPNAYIAADRTLTADWARRLAAARGIRVGLVWAGRPEHKRDRHRSLALSHLAPLGAVAGATFFSLQKGAGAAQTATPPAGLALIDLAPAIGDFADTAAAVACLDLVITVDTSVAHLAAAMGKPVWLLLPQAPDWRWLLGRADSPWYASARLFRQSVAGDWAGVIAEVAAALGSFFAWEQEASRLAKTG